MGSTNDLKNGSVIKYNNDNYLVENVEFRKPGKGGAFYQVKLRNLLKGNKTENKFRSGESIEFVRIENRPYQYLYQDGDMYVFMNNETYDQISLPQEMVGDQKLWLRENDDVTIMFEGEIALAVQIQQHLNLTITHTEPGLKGDTATNASKPATVETGAEISVPLFINEGDKVRVDTSTGSYIERVKD
jgi:elongation factor P